MIDKDFAKIGARTLKSAGITEPPVDLERLCAYLRLHHERPWHLSTDVWDALNRPSRGRTRFKSQESRGLNARHRWKVAHEIAHHLIHGAEPHLRAGTWETHEIEYEADLLAAELLMPPSAVKKAAKAHGDDLDALAKEFGVGSREMEKRLRELGLLPEERQFRA
jgi:hypothetical protein